MNFPSASGLRAGLERPSGYPDVRDEFRFRDDFDDQLRWGFAVQGTGVNVQLGGAAGQPGLLQQSVTALNDRASAAGAINSIQLGGGGWFVEAKGKIETLSGGVDRLVTQVGFGDTLAAATDQVDAVCFENDLATNGSNNWFLLTSSSGVRTRTDLGVLAVAATYNRLRLEISADGGTCRAIIDDVLRGTVSSNMPTNSGRQLGRMVRTWKSLGAGNLLVTWDYFDCRQGFSSRR